MAFQVSHQVSHLRHLFMAPQRAWHRVPPYRVPPTARHAMRCISAFVDHEAVRIGACTSNDRYVT